ESSNPQASVSPSAPVELSLALEEPRGSTIFEGDAVQVSGRVCGSWASVDVAGHAVQPDARGAFAVKLPAPDRGGELVARACARTGRDATARLTVPVAPRTAAPSWFRALPHAERAPFPLPTGLDFDVRDGRYVCKKDGSRLIFIPAGEFEMGVANGRADEGPRHKVALSGFFIGELEITNDQFRRFVLSSGYVTRREGKSKAALRQAGVEAISNDLSWQAPWDDGDAPRGDEPVVF